MFSRRTNRGPSSPRDRLADLRGGAKSSPRSKCSVGHQSGLFQFPGGWAGTGRLRDAKDCGLDPAVHCGVKAVAALLLVEPLRFCWRSNAADKMPERDSESRVVCPFLSAGLGTHGALFSP